MDDVCALQSFFCVCDRENRESWKDLQAGKPGSSHLLQLGTCNRLHNPKRKKYKKFFFHSLICCRKKLLSHTSHDVLAYLLSAKEEFHYFMCRIKEIIWPGIVQKSRSNKVIFTMLPNSMSRKSTLIQTKFFKFMTEIHFCSYFGNRVLSYVQQS